jgi:hypothetical protein
MNYFLVVVMCMVGECQSFWQDMTYVSKTECQASAGQVVEYLSGQFPTSDGEVYCLTEAEFVDWKKDMDSGIQPELRPDHPSKQPVQPQGTDA